MILFVLTMLNFINQCYFNKTTITTQCAVKVSHLHVVNIRFV